MSTSPNPPGDPIVRGSRASSATTARFEVDFRRSTEVPVPAELIERARTEALAAGYAEGWAQGQREAKVAAQAAQARARAAEQEEAQARAAALDRALGAVLAAADQLAQQEVPVAAELESAVLHGAVELAEALLGRELAGSPERGLDALRRVMALAPETGTVTVRLHPEDLATLLAYSRRVIIVPGYGLAVAQAQHAVRELAELLEKRGVEVTYAIHPVAGRMPGHMNVLLAEANVPYEQLKEMDEINDEFKDADVALVVGANDVVNPAARSSPGSPIYGMPILNADRAKNIVFMKRSMRPGFAGIDNELLYDPKTIMFFGDAKDSLTKLVSAVKAA